MGLSPLCGGDSGKRHLKSADGKEITRTFSRYLSTGWGRGEEELGVVWGVDESMGCRATDPRTSWGTRGWGRVNEGKPAGDAGEELGLPVPGGPA